MPRYARIHAPGAVVHVIQRFVNHEFRIAGPGERAAYLARVPPALARSDRRLVAYALMSSHVHLVMLAGDAPPSCFLQPLGISFARWLNRAQRRFGPVLAERATTLVLPPADALRLVAYVHNNPVRARVARDAAETEWTSHRALAGLAPAVPGLDVALRRALCGFDDSLAGRTGLDNHVRAHRDDPRDPLLSGTTAARAEARARTALPVELASLVGVRGGVTALEHAVLHASPPAARPRWPGALDDVVDLVCAARRVTREQLCSRSRVRSTADARRLVLLVGARLLRRRLNEVASAVGLSSPAASLLLRGADARHAAEAARLALDRRSGRIASPASQVIS